MGMRVLALLGIAALGAAPAFAHHSFAMFDDHSVKVVRGTLVKFTFLNPHSWISVLGAADKGGAVERWDIEATSPVSLERAGIKANALKSGDMVTLAFHPLRDGRHGGSMVFIITPDGVTHGAKPADVGLDPVTLEAR